MDMVWHKNKRLYMKNILSVCAFLLAFGALPLWGQSQDPLNEDQTTVRILEGDNSDPSIVRYGKSYYLVHSSFVYTPGLVVYKSDDLVNWVPCSTALTTFYWRYLGSGHRIS